MIYPKPVELRLPATNLTASAIERTDVETKSLTGVGSEEDVFRRALQYFTDTIPNDVQIPLCAKEIPEISNSPEICKLKQELLKIECSILALKCQRFAPERTHIARYSIKSYSSLLKNCTYLLHSYITDSCQDH
ncbi:hypothetical protein EG68_11641 [Paragonimus skrjabini miyazakii]|uniref:Uncharacterized protein n=1 Tax=Paragonimus skrjabini miyazakii TaxID=59628 RepID=A0A8S9YLG3_9TREM|nr:hypothetical protein EG68_11641 [Paragonimus skrjabini miyazakii]